MPTKAELEEENKKLREENRRLTEEKRKSDEEMTRLTSTQQMSDLKLSSNGSSQDFVSKFSKEYSVSEILGIGGGGCVFKTVNKLDEGKYAVKRIAVDPKDKAITKKLREVRAMAQLDHPGIIRYNSTWMEEPPAEWQYDADEAILKEIKSRKRQLLDYKANSVFIYIQMQLCNYSLTDWLNLNSTQESRDLPRMKSWFKQMVEAVDYIHEKKLIHRDLKPANVLFIEKDRLKICDMGIVVEKKLDGGGVEVTMTQTGSGTDEYMSPEQSGFISRLNTKSDVFTLGLILAELCVVMNYEAKVKIFDNYRRGKPNNIFGDDDRTASFIRKLTDTDPKKRPTCRDMLNDFYLSST